MFRESLVCFSRLATLRCEKGIELHCRRFGTASSIGDMPHLQDSNATRAICVIGRHVHRVGVL